MKVFNDLKIYPEASRKYRECITSVNMIYRSSIETLCIQSVSCKMALMMTRVFKNFETDFETRKQIVVDLSASKRRLAALHISHPQYAVFAEKVSSILDLFKNDITGKGEKL